MLVSRSCRLKLAFAPLLVLASAYCAEAKDWRGILPLHSTRSDVERSFGRPAIARDNFATYDLEGERVSFDYATGGCTEHVAIWNVPPDTVISIVVIPKPRSVTFRELTLDFTKLTKIQDEESLHIFYYIDEQEGVRYEVDESDGTVTLIHYFPAKKDEHLRCPTCNTKRNRKERKPMPFPTGVRDGKPFNDWSAYWDTALKSACFPTL